MIGKGSHISNTMIISTLTALVTLKILLFNSYSSTDLEVHRNWKAIVHNLPISEWYKENTSEWTLDYPPFFAFFEKVISTVASSIGMDDILIVQKEPLYNNRVIMFMRSSVIVADILFFISVIIISEQMKNPRAKQLLFLLLSTNTALILLDNIHFQYNAFLSGIFLFSVSAMLQGKWLTGALTFSTLLNFKHIYLYYAPGYVVIYLVHFFDISNSLKRMEYSQLISKGIVLLLSLLVPFCLSFGPFIISSSNPFDQLSSIFSRLFPIQRGLTHAYWAPNAWAIYNTIDLILNKIINRSGKAILSIPTYTSGLVQEYDHTVLPTVGVRESLICVLISLIPLLFLIIRNGGKVKDDKSKILFTPISHPCYILLLSSISLFFFGYHVHEKAIILLLFPLIILSTQYALYSTLLIDMILVVSSSLSPLLFTTSELFIRSSFFVFQLSATLLFLTRVHCLPLSTLLPIKRIILILIFIYLEMYDAFIHKCISSSPFLSLLLISLFNSLIILSIYIRLLSLAIPYPYIYWSKRKCLKKEMFYMNGQGISSIHQVDQVSIVCAIDMEVTSHDPTLATIALVFYNVETGEQIHMEGEQVIYDQPYIPHFLALTEEPHMSAIFKKIIDRNPSLFPQVIICDGNGRFHPRKFGLACHVSASTGLATIGVSKNIDWGVIKEGNAKKDHGERLKKLLSNLPNKLGWAPLDLFLPHSCNVITLPKSTKRIFVSSGLGITLNTSTILMIKLLSKGIHPTGDADKEARRLAASIST